MMPSGGGGGGRAVSWLRSKGFRFEGVLNTWKSAHTNTRNDEERGRGAALKRYFWLIGRFFTQQLHFFTLVKGISWPRPVLWAINCRGKRNYTQDVAYTSWSLIRGKWMPTSHQAPRKLFFWVKSGVSQSSTFILSKNWFLNFDI